MKPANIVAFCGWYLKNESIPSGGSPPSDGPWIFLEMPSLAKAEMQWYALQVRCGRESLVAKILANKGYCVFLPALESTNRRAKRLKTFKSPLFPGYVFCQFRFSERSVPVVTTPGVQRIVGDGSTPWPVSEMELEAVRSICNSGLPRSPWPYSQSDSQVRVLDGPLAGVVGTLVTVNGRENLVVTISLLQRSVSVSIPPRSTKVMVTAASAQR